MARVRYWESARRVAAVSVAANRSFLAEAFEVIRETRAHQYLG